MFLYSKFNEVNYWLESVNIPHVFFFSYTMSSLIYIKIAY